jgi:hypothetical protein
MGLSSAPELMHTITATLAGDPLYAKPSASAPKGVTTKIWIDNVQATGGRAAVESYLQSFDATVARCKATLSADDSYCGTTYKFLGVIFDHKSHTVSCSSKIPSRVKNVPLGQLSIGALEALLGRLTHAAAILNIPLQQFWWLLKSVRRRLSALNRGLRTRLDPAALPPVALMQLADWRERVVRNTPRTVPRLDISKQEFTLFTDATLQGYGAVLLDHATQQIRVTGGKWRQPAVIISAAETRAITVAITAFARHLHRSTVYVRVDNTSALAAVQRGHSKSFVVNEELRQFCAAQRQMHVRFVFTYIASAANPADAPSRGAPVDPELLSRAIGPRDTCDREGFEHTNV